MKQLGSSQVPLPFYKHWVQGLLAFRGMSFEPRRRGFDAMPRAWVRTGRERRERDLVRIASASSESFM